MSWSDVASKTSLSSVEIQKIKSFDVATSSYTEHDDKPLTAEPADSFANLDLDGKSVPATASTAPPGGGDDEVYDSAYISSSTNCLAIATNNPDLGILDLAKGRCFYGTGHSQSILCVDSPEWDDLLLASGSKDNSIIFWRLKILEAQKMEVDYEDDGGGDEQHRKREEAADMAVEQLAVATGHTHSVSSIAFSHSKTLPFLVSVSHDTTLKLWPLSELIVKQENGDSNTEQKPLKMSAISTFVAHSKDINSVDISENDKLCVTASMDKSAKLWHIDRKKMEFTIAGTLGGHKRGVWSARFSRNLQLVATCSGDCTIKLFSLLDKSCTRTLEGHQFAVLSVLFIDKSAKLVSVDGGGIVKIWDVKRGICEKTEAGHDEKIWALREMPTMEDSESGKEKARFVTGAADGQLAIWEDRTEELKEQRRREAAKRVTDKQTLANLLQQERPFEALLFTLDLNQPFQCLQVLDKLLHSEEGGSMEEKEQQFIKLIKQLTSTQLSTLLQYASQWNTNTRTYATGQLVLNCVLRSVPPNEMLKLPNIETIIAGFLPYSLRHYERLKNLRKNAAHLDYVFSSMRLN